MERLGLRSWLTPDATIRRASMSRPEQVHALVENLTRSDLVAGPPRENVSERGLARAVRPHDGVHLAGSDGEVHPAQDLVSPDRRVKILNFQKHLPHRAFQRHAQEL